MATADAYAITSRAQSSDPGLTVASPGLLANDSSPTGASITAVEVANPAHGTVMLNSDGSFVYTPSLGYLGSDSFTYMATDGLLDSSVATVSLTVTPRLSIPTNLSTVPGGTVVVPVNIDNPEPRRHGWTHRRSAGNRLTTQPSLP